MKQEIKEYICKYCGETFIGTRGGFSNHLRFCKMNPNEYPPKKKHKETKQPRNIYKLKCQLCGNEYELELTEIQYNSGKYSKFCSRSCANTRYHSDETKNKIKIGRQKYLDTLPKKIKHKFWYCGTEELTNKYPDISKRQSKKWFNKFIPFGLDISKLGTEQFVDEFYKCKELLYKEYVLNKLSPADIYKKYNCSEYIKHSETLLHIFKDFGFNTRSYSNAVLECHLQGKLNCWETKIYPYKRGWHTTWNNKEIYYRSSYELDYAIELDNKQIDYEVESLRIKYFDSVLNEYRCAIPDFYIPSTNEVIEIKSTYTLDIQNMKDKFKTYIELGYKPKLILEHKEVDINIL